MPNKKRLFIIGASNLGREMETWLDLIPLGDRDWEIEGYLHSEESGSPLKAYPTDYSILGNWENFPLTTDDLCIIAVADYSWKEKIYTFLKDKTNFLTYVAPSAIIGKFSNIGTGSVICPNCTVSTNVKIRKCVFINCGSQIGHDVEIGDFTSLMANVDIAGNCSIGEKVFIGSNAVIIPKIVIQDKSIIGAGSVVIKKVKEGTTVFGNPAKVISL